MMVQDIHRPPKVFDITFDSGRDGEGRITYQELEVSHSDFESDPIFRKFMVHKKCRRCGVEETFEGESKQ